MQSKATRYSGDIKISIVYSDEEQEYACRLEADGERTEYTTVGEPKILRRSTRRPTPP
jgi:hypothetical protein